MKHFGTATGDSQIKCARFVDFMRGCGCSRAILKSDEPTIVGFETLKNAWPLGIVLDNSPNGGNCSNGAAKHAERERQN